MLRHQWADNFNNIHIRLYYFQAVKHRIEVCHIVTWIIVKIQRTLKVKHLCLASRPPSVPSPWPALIPAGPASPHLQHLSAEKGPVNSFHSSFQSASSQRQGTKRPGRARNDTLHSTLPCMQCLSLYCLSALTTPAILNTSKVFQLTHWRNLSYHTWVTTQVTSLLS